MSVEDGKHHDRIDHLRYLPASIKFISFEPLIGALGNPDLTNIDWVIAGGESGNSKSLRPVKKDWVTSLRDQCTTENIPFFFKQWGKKEFNPDQSDPTIPVRGEKDAAGTHKPKGGHLIDGQAFEQFPVFPIHYPDVELKARVDSLEKKLEGSITAYTKSWLTIGQSLSEIKKTIEDLGHGKLFWQTYFKVDSFQEYCNDRLSLSREAATQMRQGYELIQTLRPTLIGENQEEIPNYTKLRVIAPHMDKLSKDPDKYEELINHAFDDTPRSELEKEARNIFKPGPKKTESPKYMSPRATDWTAYVEAMEAEISNQISDEGVIELKRILGELKLLLDTHAK